MASQISDATASMVFFVKTKCKKNSFQKIKVVRLRVTWILLFKKNSYLRINKLKIIFFCINFIRNNKILSVNLPLPPLPPLPLRPRPLSKSRSVFVLLSLALSLFGWYTSLSKFFRSSVFLLADDIRPPV